MKLYRLKITSPLGTITTGKMNEIHLQHVKEFYLKHHGNCTFEIIQP
jgi:hypothetical protein